MDGKLSPAGQWDCPGWHACMTIDTLASTDA